ncbi:GNAT family N-acetyltransferase [Methanogenium sp. S4BF]|uniref:GNAT family N-acetyltransferase n=1 Tax=Methanogenium sp. S4BF TaxID=1789226 RepID=UPI0024171B04|nr:GNAT family N-acetyltransferase [Methanogenium sp. S4BF]WFN35584.1 GNAT family N-acetyltransferase [Methanogenium sp. S4BF]
MTTGDDTDAHAGLQIRVAVPADGDVIAARNCDMAYETEGRMLDPETAKHGALSLLKDPAKGWYLVAEYNGKVVGQCMITREWSDWRNGHYWWIQSVYIVPECRRTGVFSALYAWISGEAHRRPDVAGLRLYVEEENWAAREAYRSLGMKHAAYVMYEDIFGDTAEKVIPSRIAGSD